MLPHLLALARRLRLSAPASILAALLFGLHPSRVENVAWISAQKDLGSTFLVLAALYVYAPILRQPRASGQRLLGVWGLFLLALRYKSQAVVFPVLLLALDLGWRRPPRRAVAEKLPFFVLSLVFAGITMEAGVHMAPIGGSWSSHVATVLRAPLLYLRLVLLPCWGSAWYWVPREISVLAIGPLAGAAVVLGLVVGGWLLFRREPRVAMLAVAWPLICLTPVANLVPLPIEVADRYLYLALAGPSLAVSLACFPAGGARELRSRVRGGIALALVLALGGLCARRSPVFRTDRSLWRWSLAENPDSPRVRYQLAIQALAEQAPEKALAWLDIPWTGASQPLLVARADALRRLGREREAGEALDRVARLAAAHGWRWSSAKAVADRLRAHGQTDRANELLRSVRPSADLDQIRRRWALLDVARKDERLRPSLELVRLQPFDSLAWNRRGLAIEAAGERAAAARAFARMQAILGG